MPARQYRVTRGEDYRRIVRTGNRVGGAFCVTYAVPRALLADTSVTVEQETPVRFGYIISKAVGNAVTRNLIRRRMKSVTQEMIRDGMNGTDIVFRALPAAATATYEELRRGMKKAVLRLEESR